MYIEKECRSGRLQRSGGGHEEGNGGGARCLPAHTLFRVTLTDQNGTIKSVQRFFQCMVGFLCPLSCQSVCLSIWGKQKRLLFANLIPVGDGFPATPGIPGCTQTTYCQGVSSLGAGKRNTVHDNQRFVCMTVPCSCVLNAIPACYKPGICF